MEIISGGLPVSVIIIAYNIEDYIDRCIDSVINQTYTDIEIIIVNDGSTDNTYSRINQKAKNDKRIKVINKANGGIVDARIAGIEASTGEYILFVDGDDWIERETVEILYDKAKNSKYDILKYKHILQYDDGTSKLGWDYKYNELKELEYLDLCLTNQININLVTQFIKRDFLLNNQIQFPLGLSFGEDVAITCTLATKKPKVFIVNHYLYNYYQRKTSLTKKLTYKSLEIKQCMLYIREQLINNNLFDKYKKEYEFLVYMHCYYFRKEYILNNNNLSKELFKIWKSFEININSKNNIYYKKLYMNECIKYKVLIFCLERSYYCGVLYNKLVNK